MTAPMITAAAPIDGSRVWVQWTLSDCGRSRIVSFAGAVDRSNADYLVDTLGVALASGTERLIFDFTRVSFPDVAGAGALLATQQYAAAQDVRLDVVCPDSIPGELGLVSQGIAPFVHVDVSTALMAQAGS